MGDLTNFGIRNFEKFPHASEENFLQSPNIIMRTTFKVRYRYLKEIPFQIQAQIPFCVLNFSSIPSPQPPKKFIFTVKSNI